MDLELRTAQPEEAYKIALLTRGAMLSYGKDSKIPYGMLESLTESVESVEDRIRHGHCLCLWDGPEPVATVTLTMVKNPLKYSFSEKTEEALARIAPAGYISRFAVRSDLRFLGMGVKLLDAAEEKARELNAKGLILHSSSDNRSLSTFYSNRGFVLTDTESSRGYNRGLFIKKL
ncbi:MAG: GNAT family N-acetyltransferase [Clostridiales bacterium]|nr:GNAT family N-acetyltransferase [Clostridiales bacterium]